MAIYDNWRAVTAGTYDADIRARAQRYATFQSTGPIIVTFSPNASVGASDTYGPDWAAAYMHVYDVMLNATGMTNVAFVPVFNWTLFSATNTSQDPGNWLLPGVLSRMPFLGVSVYQDVNQASYATRMPDILNWLSSQGFASKMLGISDTASTAFYGGNAAAAQWWSDQWAWIKANTNKVGVVCWYDGPGNNSINWSLGESAEKAAAFGDGADDAVATYLDGSVPPSPSPSPSPSPPPPPTVKEWPGYKPGKIYLGTSEVATRTTDNTEADINAQLGLGREFYINYSSVSLEKSFALGEVAAGRIPWISFKVSQNASTILADWTSTKNGANDTALNTRAAAYASVGVPMIVTWNGQPDRDGTTSTDGANFRAAWKHIQAIFATKCPNVAFAPLVTDEEWFTGNPLWWLDNTMLDLAPFLAVRCDKNANNDTYATRLPTILSWLDGRGYTNMQIGVGLTNGYTSTGQTGAQWWTDSWAYATGHVDRIGVVSYHNTDATPPPSGSFLITESAAKVTAFHNSASSAYAAFPSSVVTSPPPPPPVNTPTKVTGLTAPTVTTSAITLQWTASTAPSGYPIDTYKVFRGGTQIATPTTTLYQDTGRTADTPYTYTVSAHNSAGDGPLSDPLTVRTQPVSGPPSAPASLTHGTPTTTQIPLSWGAATAPSGDPVTGYKIYNNATNALITTTGAAARSYTVGGLSAGTAYTFYATATNTTGESVHSNTTSATTATASPSPSPSPSPPPTGAFDVFVAGDIAHQTYLSGAQSTSDYIIAQKTTGDIVIAPGDCAYSGGSISDYNSWYHPTWGRFKNITYPSTGNHDYHTSGAAGYVSYWSSGAGPGVTTNPKSYWFIKNNWLFISVDCAADTDNPTFGTAQMNVINDAIAKRPANVNGMLAFWHQPRFSSGSHGNATNEDAAVKVLYSAGVDIIIGAHDHHYERFRKTDASQAIVADTATKGFVSFVIGTGGDGPRGMGTTQPASVKIIHLPGSGVSNGKGVSTFTLGATSWSTKWRCTDGTTTQSDDAGPYPINPK